MARAVKKLDQDRFILVLVPCAIVRFALLPPLGYYWATGTRHFDVIKDHVILHNGTYNAAIAAGEKLAAKWGTFAFPWTFVVGALTFWFPPPMNFPFLVLDATITIYISIATYYQTSYAPHNKHACNPDYNPGFYNMQRPAGANESFFEAAARLNATVTTPKDMCETFVDEWQLGIAISSLYAFTTLLNLLGFFSTIYEAKKIGKSCGAMLKEVVVAGGFLILREIPHALILLLGFILYWLPASVFRCLPLSIKSLVRQGRRLVFKTGLGAEQKIELAMTELTAGMSINKLHPEGVQVGRGQFSLLSQFLDIYDMLLLVTQELHYLDVLNLACVSKSVRESVLPEQDLRRRLGVFKMYTCLEDSNAKCCWTCTNQICSVIISTATRYYGLLTLLQGCQQLRLLRQTKLLHHLDNCHPYCTSCFNTYILRHRPAPGERLENPECQCAPVTSRPNIFQLYYHGPAYYKKSQAKLPKIDRAVCRTCHLKTDDELLESKEKTIRSDLMVGMTSKGEKWITCAKPGCKNPLGNGPRWWICKRLSCGKECSSFVHKAWGRNDAGKDDCFFGEAAV